MGCGGSKATTVAIDPDNSQQSEATTAGAGSPATGERPPTPATQQATAPGGVQEAKQQVVRRPSRVAPLGASTEDLQTEELSDGDHKEQRVTDQALAFVVPFEDQPSEESIIRKHPPKRLQRLEEVSTQLPTLEDIAEKQAVAEMRRQKILQNRVQSSKNIRKSVDSDNPPDEDGANNKDGENGENKENMQESDKSTDEINQNTATKEKDESVDKVDDVDKSDKDNLDKSENENTETPDKAANATLETDKTDTADKDKEGVEY